MLDFEKRADIAGPGMRWLTVAPKHQKEVEFVLASWFPALVGQNAPCVLEPGDCRGTHEMPRGRGVKFDQSPEAKDYGIEAVFRDLYGNAYALIERGSEGG